MKNKPKEIVFFKGRKFTFGTKRKRTELDDILDQIILDNYYKSSNEKRTPEKDKEILRKSYLMPIDEED